MIDLDQARAWREAGAPFQAIADHFGVSRQAVQQALARKRTGGKPGPKRKIDYAEAVALRGDGWQHKQIAMMMGCCVSTVQRALEAARRSLWLSNYSEHEAEAAYGAWEAADAAARIAYTEGWADPSWDGIRLAL